MGTSEQCAFRGAKTLKTLREYLNSSWFYVVQLCVASWFVWTNRIVPGAVAFGALLMLILVVCDDIRATTLPFLILCTITTNLYNSYNIYIGFAKYAPIALAAIVYHYVVYRKRFVTGDSLKGIFAVSIAISFGGMGRFSFGEYMHGAYYFFGLGFGMMIAYVLLRSQFDSDDEKSREKFAFMMTVMAALCGSIVLHGYYMKYMELRIEHLYPQGFSRNNLSTILLFAMPFPLYLARKREIMAVCSVLILGILALTTSRGGLLFGCAEFVVCAAFWIFSARTQKAKKIRLIACLVACAIAIVVALPFVIDVILPRFSGDVKDETRFKMIIEGLHKFVKRPISGYGLLDHDILYEVERKKGAMTWYHMMPMQILGGMGLIGVACYGYQIVGRAKLVLQKPCPWSFVLGISYLGVLMMSLVNPGEFCPLPFELFTVLLFVLQEVRLQTARPLYNDRLRQGV